jgi:hypothetical protein
MISNTYVNNDKTFRHCIYSLTTNILKNSKEMSAKKQYIYRGNYINEEEISTVACRTVA